MSKGKYLQIPGCCRTAAIRTRQPAGPPWTFEFSANTAYVEAVTVHDQGTSFISHTLLRRRHKDIAFEARGAFLVFRPAPRLSSWVPQPGVS